MSEVLGKVFANPALEAPATALIVLNSSVHTQSEERGEGLAIEGK